MKSHKTKWIRKNEEEEENWIPGGSKDLASRYTLKRRKLEEERRRANIKFKKQPNKQVSYKQETRLLANKNVFSVRISYTNSKKGSDWRDKSLSFGKVWFAPSSSCVEKHSMGNQSLHHCSSWLNRNEINDSGNL